MMPEKYQCGPGNGDSIGDVSWGKTLAHELGHYVFWLGDEYMDWHERIYYVPDSIFEGVVPTYLLGGIAYSRTTAGWFYNNRVPPHSIMDMTYEYSELSWPADYERFKAKLTKKFHEEWEEHMTYQWFGTIKTIVINNTEVDISWQRSSWEAVFSVLTGYNVPHKILDSKRHICIDLDFDGSCDTNFDRKYIPKTGPYTGVGYFMEVVWG